MGELSDDIVKRYIQNCLILSVLWAFSSDCNLDDRNDFNTFISRNTNMVGYSLFDYDVDVKSGEWMKIKVEETDIESVNLFVDTVIPTIDTTRHERLLYKFLKESKPLILVGPPGTKT